MSVVRFPPTDADGEATEASEKTLGSSNNSESSASERAVPMPAPRPPVAVALPSPIKTVARQRSASDMPPSGISVTGSGGNVRSHPIPLLVSHSGSGFR